MKAVVHETYGPPEVLKLVEVEKPQAPDDGVLVRVHASSVNIAICLSSSIASGAGTDHAASELIADWA